MHTGSPAGGVGGAGSKAGMGLPRNGEVIGGAGGMGTTKMETKSLRQHKFRAAGTARPLPSAFHCSVYLPASPVALGHAWAVMQLLERLSRKKWVAPLTLELNQGSLERFRD